MAQRFRDEDDIISEFGVGDVDEGDDGVMSQDEVREEAVSVQRLVVSKAARRYVEGRMAVATVDSAKPVTAEKMFHVPKLLEWLGGEPTDVLQALAAGRVRARLHAKMGIGKSVELCNTISTTLSIRVLHVSLDSNELQDVAIRVIEKGYAGYKRRWSRTVGPRMSCMTYADFNGYMCSPKRSELFKSFDLLFFDEAFVPSADVFVAKRNFAVYGTADISLLLASATAKVNVVGEALSGSAGMGNFETVDRDVTVSMAIQSGRLVDSRLVDRTVVFVPDVESMHDLYEHYSDYGIDVKIVDDSATFEEELEVRKWLEGDCATARVVIMSPKYAIARNFPFAYCILFPYVMAGRVEGDRYLEERVPMTAEMIVQAQARTGRGIVSESGGIVMSDAVSSTVEILPSEKLEAFVKLCAACIRPVKSGFWNDEYAVFPSGLQYGVAHTLLKCCLPVAVASRFLAEDGLIAKRYATALNAFAQPDHFILPSDHDLPVGHDSWVRASGAIQGGSDVLVPVHSDGELSVVLRSIAQIADGIYSISRWRPSRLVSFGDGYDSDEERVSPRLPQRKLNLRRIDDAEVPRYVPEPPVAAVPWSYQQGQPTNWRSGGFIDRDRIARAMEKLEASLFNYKVPNPPLDSVVETTHGSMVEVQDDSHDEPEASGVVESPGGGVVCLLPVSVCERMNMGVTLQSNEMLEVVAAGRSEPTRFVNSKLFDCLSGPWESFLRALCDEVVVQTLVRKGAATDTYRIVSEMAGRFRHELTGVVMRSNVLKKRVLKIFSRAPSVGELARAIKNGSFDNIAQTEGYISRVKLIKELIDRALLRAEGANVYLPQYITHAQRPIPIRGAAPVGYLGQGMVPMPPPVKRLLGPNVIDNLRGRMQPTGW